MMPGMYATPTDWDRTCGEQKMTVNRTAQPDFPY